MKFKNATPKSTFCIIYCTLLFLASDAVYAAAVEESPLKKTVISYNDFQETREGDNFVFLGGDSSIDGWALQLTLDTLNDDFCLYNKSGRIFYNRPFKLWSSESSEDIASLTSYFLMNVYMKPEWTAGSSLKFLIAPKLTIPAKSHGQ